MERLIYKEHCSLSELLQVQECCSNPLEEMYRMRSEYVADGDSYTTFLIPLSVADLKSLELHKLVTFHKNQLLRLF